MPKQEELREGIAETTITVLIDETDYLESPALNQVAGDITEKVLKYLHSQGVVIKVDCPKCSGHGRPNKVTYNLHTGYCVSGHSCPNCNNTGYVAVEPLVANNVESLIE